MLLSYLRCPAIVIIYILRSAFCFPKPWRAEESGPILFLNRLQTFQQTYNVAHYPVANLELQHFVAQTNRYTGQTAKSAELYKACIEESDRLNYTGYGYVEMLIGITFNYMLLADYEKAYYCILRAEALAGVEKNPLQLATVYYYRAGIDRQLSANHDAVLYLVKASRLAKQSGELMLIVAIAEELASYLYSIGKERYAIRIYKGAYRRRTCIFIDIAVRRKSFSQPITKG